MCNTFHLCNFTHFKIYTIPSREFLFHVSLSLQTVFISRDLSHSLNSLADFMPHRFFKIISGFRRLSFRRRALRENLSLENLLKLGRALELSEKQAKQVEKTDSDVHRIKSTGSDRRSRPRSTNSLPSRSTQSQSRNCHYTNKPTRASEKCGNCGGYAHHRNPCPARGTSCRACGKVGHFAHVCRSKPRTVAYVNPRQQSDEEYKYATE